MFSDQTLIIINAVSISFLIVMLVVLAAATRMKGSAGWAAFVIVSTTVPVYLVNLSMILGLDVYRQLLYPGIFLNLTCFPAVWFFVRSQFNRTSGFRAPDLLHFIPPVVSLAAYVIYFVPMSAEQFERARACTMAGGIILPEAINVVILYGQFFTYFPVIFFYIRKRKKYLQNNYSDSDYMNIRWIPGFLWVFFSLFLIMIAGYVVDPFSSAWLAPLLNAAGMAYLVYNFIFHSTTAYINRLPDASAVVENDPENETHSPSMDAAQMKEICDKVVEYLIVTKAYTNPDLSLPMLSHETGIHHKNISTAINGYLHRNFFELVNGLRVEEAKRLLTDLSKSNYTVESVYAECGFRSRSTYFMTFKKFEGISPARWLETTAAD